MNPLVSYTFCKRCKKAGAHKTSVKIRNVFVKRANSPEHHYSFTPTFLHRSHPTDYIASGLLTPAHNQSISIGNSNTYSTVQNYTVQFGSVK